MDIYEFLDGIGVKYVVHEHPPVFTCEDADEHFHTIEGIHTKNLFLRNKNSTKYYLVSVLSKKRVDLKELRRFFGESKLSFGSPEKMMEYLGVVPGSVSPFGMINDLENELLYFLDEAIADSTELVNFHPNKNTATLGLSAADFYKFLEAVGNRFEKIKIPEVRDDL